MFKFLGMTVAVVTDEILHPARKELFQADVLYITAAQLAFTYLHDNTAKEEHAVVRGFQSHPQQQHADVHSPTWPFCEVLSCTGNTAKAELCLKANDDWLFEVNLTCSESVMAIA